MPEVNVKGIGCLLLVVGAVLGHLAILVAKAALHWAAPILIRLLENLT